MPRGGLTISLESLSFVDELSEVELQDLKERLNYVGYSPTGEKAEIKSILSLFLEILMQVWGLESKPRKLKREPRWKPQRRMI